MEDIKKINKNLDNIKKELIHQLKNNNIEYVDLITYGIRVNNLKAKKDYLYLKQSLQIK